MELQVIWNSGKYTLSPTFQVPRPTTGTEAPEASLTAGIWGEDISEKLRVVLKEWLSESTVKSKSVCRRLDANIWSLESRVHMPAKHHFSLYPGFDWLDNCKFYKVAFVLDDPAPSVFLRVLIGDSIAGMIFVSRQPGQQIRAKIKMEC